MKESFVKQYFSQISMKLLPYFFPPILANSFIPNTEKPCTKSTLFGTTVSLQLYLWASEARFQAYEECKV